MIDYLVGLVQPIFDLVKKLLEIYDLLLYVLAIKIGNLDGTQKKGQDPVVSKSNFEFLMYVRQNLYVVIYAFCGLIFFAVFCCILVWWANRKGWCQKKRQCGTKITQQTNKHIQQPKYNRDSKQNLQKETNQGEDVKNQDNKKEKQEKLNEKNKQKQE